MNFISTFDELNKLYEEATPKVVLKKVDDLCAVMLDGQQKYTGTREECENWLKDKTGPLASRFKIVQGADVPIIEALTEATNDVNAEVNTSTETASADDAKVTAKGPSDNKVDNKHAGAFDVGEVDPNSGRNRVVEAVEDEEEPRQVICECDKCGALVIKDEADIVVDEETDLVNVEEECQFCEEANGYKIIGVVAPYEAVEDGSEAEEEPIEGDEAAEDDEALEELLDVKPNISLSLDGGEGNDVDVL